ncbi:hypothetical protein RHMOL_Rhmol06G0298700 [Rhododendron molle]|uniref:Uncharacterized protein n=1 Tax=Rhododendron molle TaxID=49168 RepID=A0ACC0NHK3_RHOML|nr:hypothetical protein RHMOL_Rhmol06G0298700 [Rhododendron molle]
MERKNHFWRKKRNQLNVNYYRSRTSFSMDDRPVERPDVRMQYYYGTFAYLPFKLRVLLKWADGMKLRQKMLPGKKEEK